MHRTSEGSFRSLGEVIAGIVERVWEARMALHLTGIVRTEREEDVRLRLAAARTWMLAYPEAVLARVAEADADSAAEPAPITPQEALDVVVDACGKRLYSSTDLGRLRGAVDRADAPQTGRAGADAGVGRAIGGGRAD